MTAHWTLEGVIADAIDANRAEQGPRVDTGSGDGWSGELTCGACPVQISGTVDGLPFYFHARGGDWSFSIAQSADADPIEVAIGLADGWIAEGDDPHDGWMPHADAWRLIAESVAKFRAERASC